jgi:hypothetical protein
MGDDAVAWSGGDVTLKGVSEGWMRGGDAMDAGSLSGSLEDLVEIPEPYDGVDDMLTKVLANAGMEVEYGGRWKSMESTAYAESSDSIVHILRESKSAADFEWDHERSGSIVATTLAGVVTIRSVAKRTGAYESSLPSGAHSEVSTNQGYWYRFNTSCRKDGDDEDDKVMGTTVGMCSALLLVVRYGEDGDQEEVCISGVMNNGQMSSVMVRRVP